MNAGPANKARLRFVCIEGKGKMMLGNVVPPPHEGLHGSGSIDTPCLLEFATFLSGYNQYPVGDGNGDTIY
jgi:hypothetical protein